MRKKRHLAFVLCEPVTVLLITVAVFRWSSTIALAERGDAVGGEGLLLLLPVVYCIGKRILLDWIAEIRGR